MSSDRPPVPQINHPRSATPTPERSLSSSQGRVSSPSDHVGTSSIAQRNPPTKLLRTPSISHVQPRPDVSYFSPRIHPSLYANTRPSSPSENLLTHCVSPQISSCGSISYQSSDAGRSPWSNSSSGFLTPPPINLNTENPPYKPRRRSSRSLTMLERPRRARTMSDDKNNKSRRRHQHRHKHHRKKPKFYKHRNREYWWLPGNLVAPTASPLLQGRVGHYVPRANHNSNTNAIGGLSPGLTARPALPTTTRRWSSVEGGVHSFNPESKSHAGAATIILPHKPPHGDRYNSKDPESRPRSSTFKHQAVEHDIVRTVRERLTIHKVAPTQLEVPASITLRRASGESNKSVVAKTPPALPSSDESSGGTTPLARQNVNLHQQRPSTAYLITNEDIDSITGLIEDNLKRRCGTQKHDNIRPGSTPPSNRSTRTPTFTSKGIVPRNSFPAELTLTIGEVNPSCSKHHSPLDYLHAIPKVERKSDSLPRNNSKKSTHEVIWKGGASAHSTSSATDQGERKLSINSKKASESGSPGDYERPDLFPDGQSRPPLIRDNGDAFDPNNARASINKWTWRLPHNEIDIIVTSSESEPDSLLKSKKTTPKNPAIPPGLISKERPCPKVKPFLRYVASETKLQDVVSFPALLPRKATSDWYSPVPEMKLSPPPPKQPRSLHNMGLDVTTRGPASDKTRTPNTPSSRTASAEFPKHSRTEFIPTSQVRSYKSADFNPDVDTRRRSVIKAHPKASARVGQRSAVGCSIGASSGEKRRSSTPRLQRVKTIDNVHKGEHPPSSKWRPPSVCPSPMAPSPTEDSETREEWLSGSGTSTIGVAPVTGAETGVQRLHKLKSGLSDRATLVRNAGPPIPNVDCVGIYTSITGTRSGSRNGMREGAVLQRGEEKGKAKDICVEPGRDLTKELCERHVCDDCEKGPRTPSVDWIG